MTRLSHAFTNFTSGELSDRLTGRVDLSKYANGATTLENFIVHAHGGAARRPGTKYVAEVKTSSLKTRLIPFEFSNEQTYVIELGNQYARFYKDNGQITSSGSAYEISTPYLTAELFQVKFAQSADVMYLVHPNHAPRKLTRTGHTAWTLTEVDFQFGPFQDENDTDTTLTASSRTGSSITLTASASLFASTDVGRLVKIHEGFAKITAFTSATVVTAAVQKNLKGDSELFPEYTASTISFTEGDPDGTGQEHNDRITDSAKQFIKQGFKDNMTITISGTSSNNGDALIVKVTADTILTSPSDDLDNEAASSGNTIVGKLEATTDWSLGAFSPTTGYPAAVCFFEERLVFGGTSAQPQTVWFSEGGGFESFNTGVEDSDAMIYTIASTQVNIIHSLSPSRSLIISTSNAEFVAGSDSSGSPLTPTSIQIKRQTSHGSADVAPVNVGNVTLFLQRAKRKIREFVFNLDVDGYVAPDMTLLAEHVSEGGFEDLALQQEPDNIIWAVRGDGVLCGMTYRREENVVAWHRHPVAGIDGSATITVTDFSNIAAGTRLTLTTSTGEKVVFTCQGAGAGTPDTDKFFTNTSNNVTADNIFTAINAHDSFTVSNPPSNVVTVTETTRTGTGFLSIASEDTTRLAVTSQTGSIVESIAVIPGDIDEDQVWMIVKRTINGATKRFVEYFTPFDFGSEITSAFFVDSGLSYSGSAATTISGLGHLEGESVTILADGSAHANKTVSSGAITLDRSCTSAHIGLGYNSTLKTMRLEGGGVDGSSQGKIKRIHDVTLRLYRSVGAKIGPSESETDLIPFRSSADEMDQAIDLFTGDKFLEFPSGYDSDAFVVVKQDQPLPMTVTGIFARLQTFDR